MCQPPAHVRRCRAAVRHVRDCRVCERVRSVGTARRLPTCCDQPSVRRATSRIDQPRKRASRTSHSPSSEFGSSLMSSGLWPFGLGGIGTQLCAKMEVAKPTSAWRPHMPTPPAEIIQLVSTFAVAFTVPAFAKAIVLLYGTILTPGRRTVAAALRARPRPGRCALYQLSSPAQSGPVVAVGGPEQAALGLDRHFVPAGGCAITLADRRDVGTPPRPADSLQGLVLRCRAHHGGQGGETSLGIRWLCLAILVPVPWEQPAGGLCRSWWCPRYRPRSPRGCTSRPVP